MIPLSELFDEMHHEHEERSSAEPPPSHAAAAATPPAGVSPPVPDALEHLLRELRHEVHYLRRQQERSTTTNWIVLGAIGLVLLVCLAFCMQALRQLSHTTRTLLAVSMASGRGGGGGELRFPS
tara:strand:- start:165 stop:536 length:372 start_codon:yes stop_codon:yes gene_type:complete